MSIKKDIRGWIQLESCDIYRNMLQVEKAQEAGFFSNSHILMDLETLQLEIEEELGFKVSLRYKAIFHRKQQDTEYRIGEQSLAIRAIHIELDSKKFLINFKNIY